jgi:hypothetical protein
VKFKIVNLKKKISLYHQGMKVKCIHQNDPTKEPEWFDGGDEIEY